MALKLNTIGQLKPGIVESFGLNASIPSGYFLCDGSEVSQATYPELYAICGSIYGTPVNPANFVLPDFRGVFLRGFDDGRGVDVGRILGSIQQDAIKSHTHVVGYPGNTVNIASGASFDFQQVAGVTGFTGGNETRPRNVALNYIIKY